MQGDPLIIVGAGGHARELAQMYLLDKSDTAFVGFLDDGVTGSTPEGWPVLGHVSSWRNHAKARFAIAINDPRVRRKVVAKMRALGEPGWTTLSHPDARLGSNLSCGVGCQFFGACQITTNVRIGDFCIVNRGAQVGHDCTVGDYSSIDPQACVSGCCRIGPGCELGAGCLLRQGMVVHEGVIVGLGSIVLKDIPANAVVVGNPSRLLRLLPAW